MDNSCVFGGLCGETLSRNPEDSTLFIEGNAEIQTSFVLDEAAEASSYFAVNKNGCVFRIETGQERQDYDICESYGDSDTLIELTSENGFLLNIECLYMGRISSGTIHQLPDIRSHPELKKAFHIYAPAGKKRMKNPCALNISQHEFDMIFSDRSDHVSSYYKDGRMEYYLDCDWNLLYIKVVDLTEDEFSFLYRWVHFAQDYDPNIITQEERKLICDCSSFISRLVIYGPNAAVREKVYTFEHQHFARLIYEEQIGENLLVHLSDIQWLGEKDARRMLTPLKWSAFVLNFPDNTLQTVASKSGSPTVNFRHTLCALFEDPQEWSTFLCENEPEFYEPELYQQIFSERLKSNKHPLVESHLHECSGIYKKRTVFPNRIWYTKEPYDSQNSASPPHLPDWWSIDETGKMELRLLDRMTLPNRGIWINCENAALSNLMTKHNFPDSFDFPTGRMYHSVELVLEKSNIRVSAIPEKSADLDYDDRDFFGLFSMDAVTATMLTCLKDILTTALYFRPRYEKSDSAACREAVETAVLAFEEDYLQHAGEILRSFTQLDCSASYVTRTNHYYEPMDGFSCFGKTDNEMHYSSWIEAH